MSEDKEEDDIDIPKDFISGALKSGDRILNKKAPPRITNNNLNDLISGALKGRGFRPYSGTSYRPYD